MYTALVLLLLINVSFAAPPKLVPRIDIGGFKLEPNDDSYVLRIVEDKAQRTETVNEVTPGVLQVEGQLLQFFNPHGHLHVNYKAGPNGYVAKYTFKIEDYYVEIHNRKQLSAQVLKALVR